MLNRYLPLTVFVLGLAAPACAKTATDQPAPAVADPPKGAAEAEAFGRLSVEDVEAKISDAKAGKTTVAIFDVNGKDRFAKGHVPGAKWLEKDVSLADLPTDKATTLIFYCGNEHCMACHKGADGALKLGYSKVFIMPAGIAGWEKANKPMETA